MDGGKKGSLILLKLCTLLVHLKLFFYFGIMRENFLMDFKTDFKFEIFEILEFLVKISIGSRHSFL